MNRYIPLVAILLALTGCAGALPWNPQNNAGMTNVHIEYGEDGAIKDVRWIDGKEKQDVLLEVNLKKGTLRYSATGIEAFPAFTTRAEVEKWVAEKFADAIPEVRNAIIGAIAGVVLP